MNSLDVRLQRLEEKAGINNEIIATIFIEDNETESEAKERWLKANPNTKPSVWYFFRWGGEPFKPERSLDAQIQAEIEKLKASGLTDEEITAITGGKA